MTSLKVIIPAPFGHAEYLTLISLDMKTATVDGIVLENYFFFLAAGFLVVFAAGFFVAIIMTLSTNTRASSMGSF